MAVSSSTVSGATFIGLPSLFTVPKPLETSLNAPAIVINVVRWMEITFPAKALIESFCNDILGELTGALLGHCYLLVISGRFTKLVTIVSMKRISALGVEKILSTCGVQIWPSVDLICENGK